MLKKLTLVLLSAGALALGACSSSTPTNACTGQTMPCTAFAAGATGPQIITAVAGAAANTTFAFAAGTYTFTNTLTLPNVSGLKIIGAGIDQTIFDFSGLASGTTGEGLLTTSGASSITFQGFTVKDTPGDGIKAVGNTGVYFKNVKVYWTSADNAKHGSYGIYPVSSTNVEVSGCQVGILNADGTGSGGASDTGIYVGQSANIIVSTNKVYGNVSGIEIESCSGADVTGNTATANTAGILAFSLPGLRWPGGTSADSTLVHIANNTVTNNNTLNFGDPSGTVYHVPGGTGILLLAPSNVEVNGNTISGNKTIGLAIASYCVFDPAYCMAPTDAAFNPFSENIYVHSNTFSGNGTSPILTSADGVANQFGGLFTLLLPAFPNHVVPDIDWDGIGNEGPPTNYVPPAPGADAGTPPNPSVIAIQSNTSTTNADWCNLNFPVLVPGGDISMLTPTALNYNAVPFTVTGAPTGFPLPAITVPGAP